MRGRPLVLTFIVTILVGGIVFGFLKSDLLGGGSGKSEKKRERVSVPDVFPLEKTDIPVVIGVNGRILPERKVVIKSVVSGIIEEVHFEVDEEVKQSQILVRIQNRLPSIDLADQEAALQSRMIEAVKALWDLERKENLHGDGHVSEEELEAAQLMVQTSSVNLTRQFEAVKRARKVLGDYEVKAPWSGIILHKPVSPGTYVRVGDPIAELLYPEKMQIEIGLTEKTMLQVRRGKETGSLRVETIHGPLEIEDVRMVLEAIPVTQTYPVRFLVRNQKENPIYPGMSLRLQIHTGIKERGFHVPTDALITRADRTYLWMVKNGRAVLAPVRIVGRNQDKIRVEGDFQEGERVIIARGQELRDGQEIDFAPKAAER